MSMWMFDSFYDVWYVMLYNCVIPDSFHLKRIYWKRSLSCTFPNVFLFLFFMNKAENLYLCLWNIFQSVSWSDSVRWLCDFVFQVVRNFSGGARSLGDASIGGVFEHADGGARPTGTGPSELSPDV